MIHALTLAWICERGSRLRHHFQPTDRAFQRILRAGKPAYGERLMVSRDQATKVVEMIGQGWHTVPRTVLTKVMGGPVLMRKDDKHIMVYANSELIEPTPEEIAKW